MMHFAMQVTVSVQVEASRRLCSKVAKGEVDAALIGGEVPIEIRHVLSVSRNLSGHQSHVPVLS